MMVENKHGPDACNLKQKMKKTLRVLQSDPVVCYGIFLIGLMVMMNSCLKGIHT